MKKLFLFWVIINTSCYSFSQKSETSIPDMLQKSFIWVNQKATNAVVFAKEVYLNKLTDIPVYIFADSYYSLFINGKHIRSGPSRFDPNYPEYDSLLISKNILKQKNLITVLVYSGVSNSMRMKHTGGLTICFKVGNRLCSTDTSWKSNVNTRFKSPVSVWGGIIENINATDEADDCLYPNLKNKEWEPAEKSDGKLWGVLHQRTLPLLAHRLINPLFKPNDVTDTLFDYKFDKNYFIQPEITLSAKKGTIITLPYQGSFASSYNNRFVYIAKDGLQNFKTLEGFGITQNSLKIHSSAPITIKKINFYNPVYPYRFKNYFECSDSMLNALFKMSLHTLQQVTEDGYEDCIWERAEWMGDAGIVEYPLSRISSINEITNKPDHRLIQKMLRDIANSSDSTGKLKAHHPSSRFDIHAYIEDYSCIWIQSLRTYVERTNDIGFLSEMWPVLNRQLKEILSRKTARGLIMGREFVIFDNPLKYKVCEGATLNAFVYKALTDAAYLSIKMHDTCSEKLYKDESGNLKTAFNKYLWNDSLHLFNASLTDQPNYHSALLPLDRGIVSEQRISMVENWLLSNANNCSRKMMPYTHFWLLQFLYQHNNPDTALSIIKMRWFKMYDLYVHNGFTMSEGFSGNRPFHNFGIVPAYFFCTGILGVKETAKASDTVIINPQLGSLNYAKGNVVTEAGLIKVDWQKRGKRLYFSIGLPVHTNAELRFNNMGNDVICIDKRLYKLQKKTGYQYIVINKSCKGNIE